MPKEEVDAVLSVILNESHRQNYEKSEENQENFCSDDAEAVRNAIAAAVVICYNYFQKNLLHIVDGAENG